MSLQGTLALFPVRDSIRYPYFSTGTSDKVVVFIGGLFDGLGSVPYLPALAEALNRAGWKLYVCEWPLIQASSSIGRLHTLALAPRLSMLMLRNCRPWCVTSARRTRPLSSWDIQQAPKMFFIIC